VIDLSKYRIIDLSYELLPGERKMDGRYLHGEPFYGRPVEVQEMMAYNARMHHIQSETHNGTHVEAPYKYADHGADIASMPIESYIGEAVVCDFAHKGEGEAVTPEDLRKAGVGSGDIVLLRGGDQAEEPYLSFDAIDWLIKTGIKSIGLEGVRHSPPGTPFGKEDGDGRLLLAGIAFLDALTGLHHITKQRVFLIALPVKMRRVTASWTRAIVLEEL
jgi:arylformamidase